MKTGGSFEKKENKINPYMEWFRSQPGHLFRIMMYSTGVIVEPNLVKAREYYTRSMTDDAKYALAKMYLFGEGGSIEREKARELLEGIAHSRQDASNLLGNLYLGDIDTLKEEGDESEQMIAELTEKAIACYKKGGADGFYNLAMLYQESDKEDEALEYLKKATDERHVYAAYARSRYYYDVSKKYGADAKLSKRCKSLGDRWLERAKEWDEYNGWETTKAYYHTNQCHFRKAVCDYKLHLRAAEKGDQDSLYELGKVYQCGLGVKPNHNFLSGFIWSYFDKGVASDLCAGMIFAHANFKWEPDAVLNKCADIFSERKDDISTMYIFGKALLEKKQIDKGLVMLRRAANKNDPFAAFTLAQWYTKRDPQKSVAFYQRAISNANLRFSSHHINIVRHLMFKVGNVYEYGLSGEKNLEKAYQYYRDAAELGQYDAMCSLGYFFLKGFGVEQDTKMAEKWLLEASKRGSAMAPSTLGIMYYQGRGVEKNIEKAIAWYLLSAKRGHGDAMFMLGKIYQGEKDMQKAHSWYERAIKTAGDRNAYFALGSIYEKENNPEKAHEYYKKAADRGHNDAMFMLGEIYGEKGDIQTARSWYEKLTNKTGSKNAYFSLAIGYHKERNFTKAKECYYKSLYSQQIKQREESFVSLLTSDDPIEYIEEMAKRNWPKAIALLGVRYQEGKDVEQNIITALFLYAKNIISSRQIFSTNQFISIMCGKNVTADEKNTFWRTLVSSAEELAGRSTENNLRGILQTVNLTDKAKFPSDVISGGVYQSAIRFFTDNKDCYSIINECAHELFQKRNESVRLESGKLIVTPKGPR